MRIRHKLFLGFGALLLLLLGMGLMGVGSNRLLRGDFEDLQGESRQVMPLVQAERALWELRLGVASFTLADAEERSRILAKQPLWYRQVDENMKAFAAGFCSPEDLAALRKFQASYAKFIQARPHWFELTMAGKIQEAAIWKAQHNGRHASESIAALAQLLALHDQAFQESQRAVDSTSSRAKNLLLAFLSLALLVGMGVAFWISARISRSARELGIASRRLTIGDTSFTMQVGGNDELGYMASDLCQIADYFREVSEVSLAMSQGNLSVEVVPKSEQDRFGFAISMMIVNMRDIIGRVKTSAEYLAIAADRSNDTTQRTSESIEEIFHSIQQIANSVDQVNESSLRAAELAQNGQQEVEQTIKGMGEINLVMGEILALIEKLTSSSSQIGSIVAAIEDIAQQTNLLALNATIEAARAGEQGRGFAVVADEVRRLAKHSTQEAAQISQLIQGIQVEMSEVSTATCKGDQAIKEGIHRAHSAGDALKAIVEAVGQVKRLVEDINQSVGEQKRSSRHIVSVIEEVVVEADNLRDKSRGILDAISFFQVEDAPRTEAVTIW